MSNDPAVDQPVAPAGDTMHLPSCPRCGKPLDQVGIANRGVDLPCLGPAPEGQPEENAPRLKTIFLYCGDPACGAVLSILADPRQMEIRVIPPQMMQTGNAKGSPLTLARGPMLPPGFDPTKKGRRR